MSSVPSLPNVSGVKSGTTSLMSQDKLLSHAQSAGEKAYTQGGAPLELQGADLNALAILSLLEGSAQNLLVDGQPNPNNFATAAQVSACLINRTNDDRGNGRGYANEFNNPNLSPVLDQVFAQNRSDRNRGKYQFRVINNYGISLEDVSSHDATARTLAGAKNITVQQADALLTAFKNYLANEEYYSAASAHVGNATQFPRTSRDGVNIFESTPQQLDNLSQFQPSSIRLGGGNTSSSMPLLRSS
jgi:hypothetical protein